MSDATRAVALDAAVKIFGDSDKTGTNVLRVAAMFDNFLNSVGETAPAKVSSAGAEPAKKTTAGQDKKAASAKAATKPAVSEDEVVRGAIDQMVAEDAAADEAADVAQETKPSGVTVDDVQAVIAKCLAAGKRAEIVKVLKKYGATSATSVKKVDMAKFVNEAQAILPADEDVDLTA